jgi:energy-coupling factor transporter ATP-binding protein EcfA2
LPAAYGVTEQKVVQNQPVEPLAEQNRQQADEKQPSSGTVVVLKGTVGCGKSTYSANGKRLVEERGGKCLVVNTDIYARNRMDFTKEIIPLIRDQLVAFKANDHKDKVVIVDTCGERDYGKTLFTVDFSSWKFITVYVNLDRSDVPGYLAWSLRNVLLRGEFGPNDSFWLTPENFGQSGVYRCKKIHRQKSAALGLERYWKFDHVDINGLSVAASAYAAKVRPVYEF